MPCEENTMNSSSMPGLCKLGITARTMQREVRDSTHAVVDLRIHCVVTLPRYRSIFHICNDFFVAHGCRRKVHISLQTAWSDTTACWRPVIRISN